jgi:hypothetical protein
MRIESSVTTITWIPSEAVAGMPKLPFELGIAHYDDPPPDRLVVNPPPDRLATLDVLHQKDAFREANDLRAWIQVEDGKITDCGYSGRALIGVTRLRLGRRELSFPAVQYPVLQADPEVGPDWVRFTQTAGGHMGLPAPRRVRGKPFFKLESASAWTTLQLIIYADGTSKHALVGASTFPRHWVYDREGNLVDKSGTIDFKTWALESHGERTPWGGGEQPVLVTGVESELERELSASIMRHGTSPSRRKVDAGETLVRQGEEGQELFLLLDGVLDVEVDDEVVAQVGPGAILGERALLEGGTRTATLRAASPARVAVVPHDAVDPAALPALARMHGAEAGESD